MEKSTFLIRGIKYFLAFLYVILTFLLLPVILRSTLEAIITIFGIQILQYLFLFSLILVFIYPANKYGKNVRFMKSNYVLNRALKDWKVVAVFLILCSWGFLILGFSISAYWLREFNLWIGIILILIIVYFTIRMGFTRYKTGKFTELSKIQQFSFFSSLLLVIIVILPYFQVHSVLPIVSSEEILEFDTNSDILPLKSRFSLDVYLNGYAFDSSEISILKNVRYNNFSTLDIYYLPRENASNPVLIVIHGGGWISGSKNDIPIRSVSKFFAFHGFTVFSINYRLYPEVSFLGMLHDVRDAIVFAKNNAENYQADKNRTFLFGRSSGAQLALVAAYGTNVTFFKENCSNYSYSDLKVNGVASIYGISKTHSMASRILGVNTDEDLFLYDLASPISYINRSGLVPTFITAGSLDTLVPVDNSRILQKALSTTNNIYMYLEIPWANHSFDGVLSSLSSQLSLFFFLTFFSHFT